MKQNKKKIQDIIPPTAQIRISADLAKQIKASAAMNKLSMVEMADLLIRTGIGLLKKHE